MSANPHLSWQSPRDSVDPATQTLAKAPKTLAETGLPPRFVGDLIAKLLSCHGRLSAAGLAEKICLPPSVISEPLGELRAAKLVEIARGGSTELEHEFQLTDNGRAHAADALQRSLYAGPAPVTLNEYARAVHTQSLAHLGFDRAAVHGAFSGLTIAEDLVDNVGAALNSGRAMLLYGPAGSGKTFLAEQLAKLLPGEISVPHAIFAGGEVIQVYDPIVHEAVSSDRDDSRPIRANVDRRWVVCKRPFVLTGGELSLRMLDLQFDEVSRFYQAPPHVKANGGVFVVDDLGRQLVSPRELMNRWIVPLDRRRDYLTLHTGFKLSVPFDMAIVFSTNLRPDAIADEAFLRRFGYKVFVGPVDEDSYRQIFQGACESLGVKFDSAAFHWLLQERHSKTARPLLACYPRDLAGRIRDFAIYEGHEAVMTPLTLDRAWNTYFVGHDSQASMSASQVGEGRDSTALTEKTR